LTDTYSSVIGYCAVCSCKLRIYCVLLTSEYATSWRKLGCAVLFILI